MYLEKHTEKRAEKHPKMRPDRRNVTVKRNPSVNHSMNDAAKRDAIRAMNLREALEFYGISFNRQNAALCPFHKEKTASFRVKGDFWHCFGCGETGDLIKFVRMSFGMSYIDALDAICKDFHIAAANQSIEDQERIDRMRLERYNKMRRYTELLNERDVHMDRYLQACDALENAKRAIAESPDTDFDALADAQFAVMAAKSALERVERACAEYLHDNPSIAPQAPSKLSSNVRLPPALKWHGMEVKVNG